MKKLILISLLLSITAFCDAQEPVQDSIANAEESKKEQKKPKFQGSRVFFGGNLGFSFGNVTSIRVNPLVGYKITHKLSAGITGLYEYTGYDTYYGKQNYNNYGGSLFARFRFIPQIYAHSEFSYINYEFSRLNNEKYRVGVPFLFLGGGFTQRIGNNTYAYGQVLFDVLQDENSPYEDWAPFYSVGVTVGF